MLGSAQAEAGCPVLASALASRVDCLLFGAAQSGSQGNLCDSWAGEEDGSGGSGQNSESLFPERRNHGAAAAGKLSAE